MSKIFLSHNKNDKSFARQLADNLAKYNVDAWVDEAEIKVGDSLIEKIGTAIRNCNYLGAILSPNSIKSEWVKKEINIALNEEIEGKKIKILPILYQRCEIPSFLKDKFYADFTISFEEGLFQILTKLIPNFKSNIDEKHEETNVSNPDSREISELVRSWESLGSRILVDNEITIGIQNGLFDITPFDIASVQPISYDLRIGNVLVSGTEQFDDNFKSEGVDLPPKSTALVMTLEKLSFPKFMFGRVGGLSKFASNGIIISHGVHIDPGYTGYVFVTMYNVGNQNVRLFHGEAFLQIELNYLSIHPSATYHGVNQYRDSFSFSERETIKESSNKLSLFNMLTY